MRRPAPRVRSSSRVHSPWPSACRLEAGPWSRTCMPGPPPDPQSGSRNSPGQALVGRGLGGGVWAGASALRPSLGGRADPDGVSRDVPDALVGRGDRALHPARPTDAGRAPARCVSASGRVCRGGCREPAPRWTPTGERPRNALGRARTGVHTGLVCRGPPVQCDGGGPAAAGASAALG